MGAAIIWSYIENYRTSRLAGAVFVDQAPLQATPFTDSADLKLKITTEDR